MLKVEVASEVLPEKKKTYEGILKTDRRVNT
jgi:hypothetical protein